MWLKGLLRLLFKKNGPRRAEADALDEQRLIASTDITIKKFEHREAVRELLNETVALFRNRKSENESHH